MVFKSRAKYGRGQFCSSDCMYKSQSGENNHLWKGGVTPLNKKIRTSKEYKDWRVAVFERDNYTCQDCGSRGVELHADHIKPFAYFAELRLVIENGKTLCVPCHKKTETYGNGARKLYEHSRLIS
jgi:5-methylcytosine-specific restriction endonuclease McrA